MKVDTSKNYVALMEHIILFAKKDLKSSNDYWNKLSAKTFLDSQYCEEMQLLINDYHKMEGQKAKLNLIATSVA